MNKKILILFFAIAFTVFLSGCTFFGERGGTKLMEKELPQITANPKILDVNIPEKIDQIEKIELRGFAGRIADKLNNAKGKANGFKKISDSKAEILREKLRKLLKEKNENPNVLHFSGYGAVSLQSEPTGQADLVDFGNKIASDYLEFEIILKKLDTDIENLSQNLSQGEIDLINKYADLKENIKTIKGILIIVNDSELNQAFNEITNSLSDVAQAIIEFKNALEKAVDLS